VGLTTPRRKKISLLRKITRSLGPGQTPWINDLGKKKMDVRFGTWNVRSTYVFLYYYYWWGGTTSLGSAATSGLLYKPQMTDEDDFWSNWWNIDWQGKPKYSEKTCPSPTLSTTKSHMPRPGLESWAAAVGSQRLTASAIVRP
jgi:hypothetical protein